MAIAMLLALCSNQVVFAADKLQLYTVNYPLSYFAERIAGDLAVVTFPAPPHIDPAFWMADPETIAAFQGADLILLNGAGYAKWTAKVSLPLSRLVDTSRAFKDAYIQESAGISHSHGPGGEHQHGGVAFTTWLDLSQAAQQVERLRALGVKSVVFDPCPNRPSAGDFLTVMTENARSLSLIFGQVSAEP